MQSLIYDNTFEGILTCVYETYYRYTKACDIISQNYVQNNIFNEYITIKTDLTKAKKVSSSIIKKLGIIALKNCHYVYMSEDVSAGTIILNYLKISFTHKKNIDTMLQNKSIKKVVDISRTVSFEIHRFLGLLRFKRIMSDQKILNPEVTELQRKTQNHDYSIGIYFAEYEPDNNITVALCEHFKNRMGVQKWIINDKKRQLYAICNGHHWIIANHLPITLQKHKHFDNQYSDLWKQYFKTIAIKERENLRCQMQFMPKKYWRNLTELQ